VARGLRLLGFTMLPIACIAAGVAYQVVELIVDFGRVEQSGLLLTGAAFLGLLPALPSEAMIIVLSRAFFAARNTWIPVGAALTSVGVAIAAAVALVDPLGIVGLALALVVASWVEALILLAAFRRRHAGFGLLRLARAYALYLVAAVVAGFVADRTYDVLVGAFPAEQGPILAVAALAATGLAGLAVYLGLAAMVRIPELGASIDLLRSALSRRHA